MTIDVGGIRIGLEGATFGLEVAARSRYARFLTGAPPHLVVALQVVEDVEHQPADPVVTREGQGRYAVRYGALEGAIDTRAGRARAQVPPTVYLVDSFLRIAVSLMAVERDGLLLHASGVRVGERALVCFGPSGVGKTTVARSVAPAQVLCDEMMLVWASGRASATPFHGDLGHCLPGDAPLMALCRLKHASSDALQPLSDVQAARALLGSLVFFLREEQTTERLLDLALRICVGKTYSLAFRRETHVPTFVDAHLRRDAA